MKKSKLLFAALSLLILTSCDGLFLFPNDNNSLGNNLSEGSLSLDVIELSDIEYKIENDTTNLTISKYVGNKKDIEIPSTIEIQGVNYTIKAIGSKAFYQCKLLESILIPNSITNVEAQAFYECNSLKKVYINDLSAWCKIKFQEALYSNPLYYAHNLYLNNNLVTTLTIPNDVTSIENYAFVGASFTNISIPSSVKAIGNNAFMSCYYLKSIVIPNSVTSVGHYAFTTCPSLTIYCEVEAKPEGWDKDWNYSNQPVYWKGQWSYKDGVPTPNK